MGIAARCSLMIAERRPELTVGWGKATSDVEPLRSIFRANKTASVKARTNCLTKGSKVNNYLEAGNLHDDVTDCKKRNNKSPKTLL